MAAALAVAVPQSDPCGVQWPLVAVNAIGRFPWRAWLKGCVGDGHLGTS